MNFELAINPKLLFIYLFIFRAVANFTDVNKTIVSKKNVVEKMNIELEKANKELSVK